MKEQSLQFWAKGEPPSFNIVVADESIFTDRQNEALELAAEGLNYKEIGVRLDIKAQSVKNSFSGLGRKNTKRIRLGIFGLTEELTENRPNNRIELIVQLLKSGVLRLEDARLPKNEN